MKPIDVVNQFYMKYGEDEAACAKAYLSNNNHNQDLNINNHIKRIAVYHSVMKFGGIGRVISLMIPIYVGMNYEVILITEEISDEDYEIPSSVKRFTIVNSSDIKNGIKAYKERAKELERILTQEKIDLLIHHGVHLPFSVYDIILAKLMGIYTVAERHQVFTEEFCRINDLFFTQLEIFKIVDKLVVLSSMDERYWRSLRVDARYIENPFNTSLENIQNDLSTENIVWIGRLAINQKQYLDVLDIAKEVIIKKPYAKILMYGSGTSEDIEQLNSAIKEKGLEEKVVFCGYETNVNKIYKNARIHLVTSAYEAFPMGIYESRICGIPLVMYELPYLELLKEKKGYIASAHGDIEDMAKNICMILDNKDVEERLRAEARESINSFSSDIIYDKWKKLFHEIEQGKKDVNGSEEFGVILQTIHKHFSIAQKRYNSLLWSYEQEKVVYHVNKGIKAGKEIVICPYGMVGKKVKKMINEKGLNEAYIIDNTLSKYDSQIKSLDEIKKRDCSNMFFVICTEQRKIKQLFYEEFRTLTSENNIVCYDDEIK